MLSIPRFSIKRPVCILMCVVSLIVFGLSAILEMPLESMPAMEMPILMIMTTYPNATPEEIDAMVTDVIEKSLANITEIKTTYSVSQSSMSMVMMQFDYNVDLDKKYSDVDSALSTARLSLPDDCEDPLLMEINIQALSNSSIMMLSLQADASDNTKAYVEDTIVPEIERIEGVADVSVSGGTRKYIQVLLDENSMTQYGLAMSGVSAAIKGSEYNFGVGSLDRGDVTVSLLGNSEFSNYADIANVPLTLRTGDVIHVSDVATVTMINEAATSYDRTDGKESITLTISKNQSANTVDICNAVVKTVEKLNTSNLGVQLEVFYDSGQEIKDNIKDVALALLEGMAIAMVVLWLFLGDWKTSLIIGASMPLSVFAALALMSAFDMSLNIISLGGLLIGIGMLVDNSIVVIDSCFRAQSELKSFEDNVIEGANLVAGAIIASTLTTIVVFLPIGMMKGMSGQIFHDICYTIVFSLVSSLVSALTLVPLLFARTHPVEKEESRIAKTVNKLEDIYVRLMSRLLHKRTLVILTSIALLLITGFLYLQLGLELMADESNENLTLNIETRTGLNLDSTIEILKSVEEIVKAEPDVKSYSISGGASSGISGLMGGGGSGSVSITLKDDASMTTDEFVTHIRALTASIPNCQVGVSAQQSLSLTATDVQLTLQGKDLTLLKKTAFQIKDIIGTMPEFDSVSTSLVDGAPQAKVIVDPLLANAAGLTPSAVLMSVNQTLSGIKATTYSEGNTDYSVKVEYPADRYSDMSDLYSLMLMTPAGGQVALTDIATVEYCISPESLTRQDGEYLVTVSGTPKVGLNINALTQQAMEKVRLQMEMPQGVSFAEGSDIQTMMEEFTAIGKALLIAVYLVFLVMAIQFESLRFSAIVMISVPFAFTGAFFALFVAGSTINIASLLGIIMLCGIVVNNAIVLIDYTNILCREEGMIAEDALLRAGKTRLRPILMTTLTTVCGLIPMAFTASVPVMRSLGVCVIGGLTFSTLVTLILLPTFYLIFDKDSRMRRRADKRLAKQRKKASKRKATANDSLLTQAPEITNDATQEAIPSDAPYPDEQPPAES